MTKADEFPQKLVKASPIVNRVYDQNRGSWGTKFGFGEIGLTWQQSDLNSV